ncbi:MAG: YbaB/EbfC family nucleoid-associated protein [Spirochaetota bacterium]
MNFAEIMEMMKNPQAIQARAEELRRKTETIEATGSSGGGMVKIVINGAMTVKSIVIAPEIVVPEDVSMLQDLVIAAFNDAQAKVRDDLQRELADSLGGMGLPPGLFGGST